MIEEKETIPDKPKVLDSFPKNDAIHYNMQHCKTRSKYVYLGIFRNTKKSNDSLASTLERLVLCMNHKMHQNLTKYL